MLQEKSTNIQQVEEVEVKPSSIKGSKSGMKKLNTKLKPTKVMKFSNFQNKYRVRLSPDEICCVKVSPDNLLLAVSFANGNLKILNPNNGAEMFNITSEDLPFPVFCMCWKPQRYFDSPQKLIGVCADGRILSWTVSMGESLTH